LLLLSCFTDFWLIECKSWIGEWLLLKHVWIHFMNVCLCLYVDGIWIGWLFMKFEWKNGGFSWKWTRWWIWGELVLWLDVCCCFECLLMFINKCTSFGVEFGVNGIKNGVLGWKFKGSREETQEQGCLFWCTSPGEPLASCPVQHPCFFFVSGTWDRFGPFQTDYFDLLNCI